MQRLIDDFADLFRSFRSLDQRLKTFIGAVAIVAAYLFIQSRIDAQPVIAQKAPEPVAAKKAAPNQPAEAAATSAVLVQGTTVAAGAGLMGLMCMALPWLITLIVWFMPILIAACRNHPDTLAITIVTVALSWSGVGYIVALVWAVKAIPRGVEYR